MNTFYYIASCVFTTKYPYLSAKIQHYLKVRFNMEVMRCCAEKYKVKQFEEQMPDDYREPWRSITNYTPLKACDTMVHIWHN